MVPTLHKLKMTSVLVKELRRRAVINGEKGALFFTKAIVARPFSSVVFYTRPLNAKKVIGTGFIKLPPNADINAIEKQYQMPKSSEI